MQLRGPGQCGVSTDRGGLQAAGTPYTIARAAVWSQETRASKGGHPGWLLGPRSRIVTLTVHREGSSLFLCS
jgi:hypothetical protein